MAPSFSLKPLFGVFLLLIIESQSSSLGSSASGKSTYYGGNPSGGACGFEDIETATFPYGYYAAAGTDSFDSGYGCGACYEITCIGPYSTNPGCSCSSEHPSVTIQILDQCSECSTSHFDLDPTSMAYIVGDGLSGTCGVIETTYERVSCDIVSNIKIRSKTGTSAFWYGLHIDDVALYGGISSVEIKSNGATSYDTTCSKSSGASYWLCTGGYPLSTPMTVKLTDNIGNELIGTDVITSLDGSASFDFGSNYDTDATAQPASPTSTEVPSPTPALTPAPVSISGDVVIAMHEDNQEWWISFFLNNLNSCSETVSVVSIYYNGGWYASTTSDGNWFGFENDGVSFYDSEPMSVKIDTSNGGSYEFTDVITDVTPNNEFTIDWNLCDSTVTAEPASAPTPTTASPVPTKAITETPVTASPNKANTDTPVTASPTNRPNTPSPESKSDPEESDNLQIENHSGGGEWWYAVIVNNVPNGVEIDKVEFKDADMTDWAESSKDWDYYYWQCNSDTKPSGCPFETPFDFKVTDSNGISITGNDMINDYETGTVAYFDDNFASSASVSDQNGGNDDGDAFDLAPNEKGNYSIFEIIVICLIVFACLAAIAVACYYFYSRVYRPKHYSKSTVGMDTVEMNPETPEVEVSFELNTTQAIVAAEDDD